jgi:hypothetical protein
MNGRVHYWIVCDAVAYIKAHGDELQKRALQTLELSYGETKTVEELPAGKSAIERLAGFESWHTDKFGDLSIRVPVLPWETKRNVTGLCGHMFTAFNHFINPHPDPTNPWSTAEGYSYQASSMQGFDSFVVKGISDYLQGLVDEDHSPVLRRVRPSWTKGAPEWRDNFEREIVNTTFAPWTVLVRFYYTYFLKRQNEPLEVNGPNSHIVGLQLLGPVFHAIADACSPQHVRPALGFGHQVWENYVQSRVYSHDIDVNPNLVREMMSTQPFEPGLTAIDGPLQGRFDVESFVYALSVKTGETLNRSTSTSWSELWQAGENFWRWYLTGERMNDDARYLYNQAVAGTVYALVRAYQDLERLEIITPRNGLKDSSRLPRLSVVGDDGIAMPTKRMGEQDPPPEQARPIPFGHAEDILGFEPSGASKVKERLSEFTTLFRKSAPGQSQRKDIMDALKRLEESLVTEYQLRSDKIGRLFCPLRSVEKISLDSDISAHFGLGSFRLPSSSECGDPTVLSDYINQVEIHSEMARRLELTQAIATLRFYETKRELPELRLERINRTIELLRGARDGVPSLAPVRLAVNALERAIKGDPAFKKSGSDFLEKTISTVKEFIGSFSRIPAMAMATAVAVVLVLILIMPWGGKLPIMGLSGENWDESGYPIVAQPKDLTPKAPTREIAGPKVAIIVYFKDFPTPISQEWINSLYADLSPDDKLREKYSFVSPREVEQAVKEGKVSTEKRDMTFETLKKVLGVARVLVIDVVSAKDGIKADIELLNLENGEIESHKTLGTFNKDELPFEIDQALRLLSGEQ